MQIDTPVLVTLTEKERTVERVLRHVHFDGDPRTFAMISFVCSNPACDCKDVVLHFQALDGQGAPVRSVRPLVLVMDLATGATRPHPEETLPKDLAHLVPEVARDLPPFQRQAWAQEQGLCRRWHGHMHVSPGVQDLVLAGQTLSLSDLSDAPPTLATFQVGEEEWRVEDQHCARPTCSCQTVNLTFLGGQERAFHVELDLRSMDWTWNLEGFDEGEARRVVDTWLRQDLLSTEFLRNRMDAMRSAMTETFAPAPIRAEPKPGRNDACPCGSGKKYKKCCGR